MSGTRTAWHPRLLQWARRAGMVIAAVLVIAALVAVAAPPLVRNALQKGLGDFLQRPVSVGAVHINLLRLSASLEGIKIDGRKGEPPLLELGAVEANLALWNSLFHRAAVIQSLRIERPRLYLARESANRYSISDILDRIAAQPKKKDDEGAARFALYNLELSDGSVRFNDKPIGREHRVERLELDLPFLSSIPADVVVHMQPRLAASFNGVPLAFGGKARPFLQGQRDADLALKIEPLDLTKYLAYLPKAPGIKLESARIGADLKIQFAQQVGKAPRVAVSGRVSALGWHIQDGDGAELLGFDALNLDIAGLEPFARKAHVKQVEWVKPSFHIEFDEANKVRLVKALQREIASYAPTEKVAAPAAAAPAAPVAAAKNAWQWQVDRIAVDGGRARLTNVTMTPPVSIAAEAIAVELKGLSSALDRPTALKLSFIGDTGGKTQLEGALTPQPTQFKGVVEFAGFQVARGAPYVSATVPGLVVDAALISGRVPLEVKTGDKGVGVALTDARVVAKDVSLRRQGDKRPFFTAAEASLDALTLDLPTRTLKLSAARLTKPDVYLRRGKGGEFDLASIGRKPPGRPSAEAAAEAANPPPAGDDWKFAVGEFAIDDGVFRFEDASFATPLKLALKPISLKVTGVDSRPGQSAAIDLAAGWNDKGRLAVSGKASVQPLRADLKLDGKALDVVPLIAHATRDYEMSVTRAKVSAKGQVSLDLSKPAAPAGSFKGNLSVADFSSIDLINDEDFVRWGMLAVSRADVRLAPLSVSIGEIAMRDLQTRLILNKDGGLNLREVMQERHTDAPAPAASPAQAAADKPTAAPAPAGAPPQAATPAMPLPPIRIDRILLSGAAIAYSDRFVRPNFDARLSGVTGRLENLATDPTKVATIELKGAVDGLAPLEVSGQLAPLRNDRFLDLKVGVKGYELSALSSYAAKYVGYGIERGKLSMDLRYKIENRALSAENRVFLDQLTFGEKVESPDATSLPVRFAVNLLKNSRGEIDINLPVGGTLDDPQFSVGGIIWNMIVNFFGKVVSSPFSFLAGGGAGGGGDLSFVGFTAGSAKLDADAVKRLEGVAKALNERPAIDLDITGRADPLLDAEGLKRESFQRKVRALKLQEMAKAGESGGGMDEVRIDPAEYPRLLRKVYEAESIPNKPRNLIGLQKEIPVADMERMLAGNAKVGAEDVRTLAIARANRVQNWLVELGKVSADRVFLLAPKLGDDKDKSDAKGATSASRVDFTLR
ncbi:DUF748 domain-containing protein [Niveibacterium sp. 24ML]|uniref:DUF748 domain-containing protein n=1 Tax=Niveibacterium sp. 24ML TaxID=2985512 RepID=UPI00226DBF66|nr:DUF748 domain-containing protein [Niveibacterium sp. 24ML]MCX9157678.1 DUF748 domain-containing protein [Niveibacterium sp. 24ML]